MATKKRGVLTTSREWWEHLRWTKRRFWKAERQAAKAEAGELAGADQLEDLLAKFDPENHHHDPMLDDPPIGRETRLIPSPKR